MEKYICLHGHFYQPPRENPWTSQVDVQETAHPYHDWNERINAECYESNAKLKNYERMSFNFGPTLLTWLKEKGAYSYEAILQADQISRIRFQGHGSALAQGYNHMIMPLANERDKHTQVIWGIKDFEHRFKRKPEGMWLPETAVDVATLEVLVQHGILFTVLAPAQAAKIRKQGQRVWEEVGQYASVETKRVYKCPLPSGKSIALFFYDGSMATHVAFGGYINSATRFIHGIQREIERPFDEPTVIHCAVDGETYGHHHKRGQLVLKKVFDHFDQSDEAQLINYGSFLERHPPTFEVEIIENTAWSCDSGLNRWSKDDRHSYDTHTRKVHKWRGTLRESLNWLRDQLIDVYETQMCQFCDDPWKARDEYITLLLNLSDNNVDKFIRDIVGAGHALPLQDKTKILKLLEMQKFAMFMFTSCGWFFEDVSRIETIQILRYAARAIELAREITGISFLEDFVSRLEAAQSKDPALVNGRVIFERLIQPSMTHSP
ncbi:MAG TPA: DUF3536 domain-containing protein [Candidatus Omnitrophota bacterium]|nr:DUF3536 domain-containing protein [Candidatus Omnitrophota bacterium]